MGQPVTNQAGFRGRNDDGSETGATWVADLDTGWTQDVDTKFRVRFLLTNTGDKNEEDGYYLYYSHNSGTYTRVTTTSDVIQSTGSANTTWTLTDGDDTTQQIGSGTFDTGDWDDNGVTESFTLTYGHETELEFCLTIDSGTVADEDTIELRVRFDDGSEIDNYLTGKTPSITVNEVITTLEVSESESVTASDAPVAAIVVSASKTESATASDTAAVALVSLTISKAESITAADSPTALPVLETSAAESITAGDTTGQDVISLASTSESVGVSATASHYADLVVVMDRPPVVSVQEPTVDRDISVNDGVTVADTAAASLALAISVADGVTAVDSPTARPVCVVAEAETVTAGDTAAIALATLEAANAETVTVADAPTLRTDALAVSEAETVTASDTPAVSVVEAGLITISKSESIGVSDTPTSDIGLAVSESESITAADAASTSVVLGPSASDATTVADTPIVAIGLEVAASEAATVADSAAVGLAVDAAASDGVTVSDAPQVQVTEPGVPYVNVSDGLTVSDSPVVRPALAVSIAETITVADTATVGAPEAEARSLTVADALTVSDSRIVTLGDLQAAITEAITASDTASAVYGLEATVSDGVTAADTAPLLSITTDLWLSVSDSVSVEPSIVASVIALLLDVRLRDSLANRLTIGDALVGRLRLGDALADEVLIEDDTR